MRAWIVALVASSRFAHADFVPEWRDGCPAGNFASKPDAELRLPDDDVPRADPPPATRPSKVGTLPQSDSPFARNGAGLDGFAAHYLGAHPGEVTELWGWDAHGSFTLATGGLFDAEMRKAVGVNVSIAQEYQAHGTASFMQLGNLVLAPHLNWQWNARGTNVTRLDDVEPANLRNGFAFQAIFGIPVDSSAAAQSRAIEAWRRLPFEGYKFSSESTYGGAFEMRSESVGCYAPFIHVRFSLQYTNIADGGRPDHYAFLAPQSLTVGFKASSHIAASLQYGLLVYVGPKNREQVVELPLGATTLHRFRVGAGLDYSAFNIELHLDLIRGSDLYNGTAIGASLNLTPGDRL